MSIFWRKTAFVVVVVAAAAAALGWVSTCQTFILVEAFAGVPTPSALSATTSRGQQNDVPQKRHHHPSLEELQQLVIASSLSYLPVGKKKDAGAAAAAAVDVDFDRSSMSDSITSSRRPAEDGASGTTNARRTMEMSPYYDSSRLQPITQFVDPISQSGATIFRAGTIDPNDDIDDDNNNSSSSSKTTDEDKNLHHIIVACRGSANIANFMTNLDFQLVPVNGSLCPDAPPDAFVHRGFQLASLNLWKLIESELWNVVHSTAAAADTASGTSHQIHVTFTGHSLGAATALLCATQFAPTVTTERQQQQQEQQQQEQRHSTNTQLSYSIVTVGGPRLVNTVLADHLRRIVLSESTCVMNLIHSQDPILRQNQVLWDQLGFEAVGHERLCSMDQLMAFQTSTLQSDVLAWNFLDHCRYLGIFVGPRVL